MRAETGGVDRGVTAEGFTRVCQGDFSISRVLGTPTMSIH